MDQLELTATGTTRRIMVIEIDGLTLILIGLESRIKNNNNAIM